MSMQTDEFKKTLELARECGQYQGREITRRCYEQCLINHLHEAMTSEYCSEDYVDGLKAACRILQIDTQEGK
jgi:hypothetical protein